MSSVIAWFLLMLWQSSNKNLKLFMQESTRLYFFRRLKHEIFFFYACCRKMVHAQFAKFLEGQLSQFEICAVCCIEGTY